MHVAEKKKRQEEKTIIYKNVVYVIYRRSWLCGGIKITHNLWTEDITDCWCFSCLYIISGEDENLHKTRKIFSMCAAQQHIEHMASTSIRKIKIRYKNERYLYFSFLYSQIWLDSLLILMLKDHFILLGLIYSNEILNNKILCAHPKH